MRDTLKGIRIIGFWLWWHLWRYNVNDEYGNVSRREYHRVRAMDRLRRHVLKHVPDATNIRTRIHGPWPSSWYLAAYTPTTVEFDTPTALHIGQSLMDRGWAKRVNDDG